VIEQARDSLSHFAGCDREEVIFISGGSEANALALRGAAAGAAEAGKRITRLMISAIEHESVLANAAALADSQPGLKLHHIPARSDGAIDIAALRFMLMQGKGRLLVSVMAANNETGVVQDTGEIAKLVKREGGPEALVHVDAVQAAAHVPVSLLSSGADYLTISSHKLGGPLGAGALFVKKNAPLSAQIAGGGQEMRRRAGTENVAAIAGFGAVAAEIDELGSCAAALKAMRDRFEAGLKVLAPDVVIFGAQSERLPNTSNFAIPGLGAETALIALDLDGIAVSSGAACSSGKVTPSHVLAAMGVEEGLAHCAIRVSFGWQSADADVDVLIDSLRRLLARRAALAA
jgi:cysteine desulfurase